MQLMNTCSYLGCFVFQTVMTFNLYDSKRCDQPQPAEFYDSWRTEKNVLIISKIKKHFSDTIHISKYNRIECLYLSPIGEMDT